MVSVKITPSCTFRANGIDKNYTLMYAEVFLACMAADDRELLQCEHNMSSTYHLPHVWQAKCTIILYSKPRFELQTLGWKLQTQV